MLELQGKFNSARVYTDNIDSETISQIVNLCNQVPLMKHQWLISLSKTLLTIFKMLLK